MTENRKAASRWSVRRLSPHARLSIRAAICLSTPLVVGLVVGQRAYGTLVALGTLWAVSQDGADRWRTRSPRLLGVALAGGTGVADPGNPRPQSTVDFKTTAIRPPFGSTCRLNPRYFPIVSAHPRRVSPEVSPSEAPARPPPRAAARAVRTFATASSACALVMSIARIPVRRPGETRTRPAA